MVEANSPAPHDDQAGNGEGVMAQHGPKLTPINKGKGNAPNDIAELSAQVAEAFEKNYPPSPWPEDRDPQRGPNCREHHAEVAVLARCYPVAVIISVIRNATSYTENFRQENHSRRKRRAVIESMKRLIKERTEILNIQFSMVETSECQQDSRKLQTLEAALEEAVPELCPFDSLAGERDNAWWHKAARMIAERAETALVQAGHGKIPRSKHGPFVKVIAELLKLATDKVFEPATVAHAIRKLNATELMG